MKHNHGYPGLTVEVVQHETWPAAWVVHGALKGARWSRWAVLAVLLTTWQVMRLGLCALLVLLEPVVALTLVPAAFLGLLVTLIFGFVARDPYFPRWGMLAMSVGALCLYWLFVMLTVVVTEGGGRGRR